MQNKANLRKSQMDVNSAMAKDYENISDWTLGENKPNSNPIQTQTKPICQRVKLMAMCVFTKDYGEKCG